jgi:hypothetical protein
MWDLTNPIDRWIGIIGKIMADDCGFGDIEVACWPLVSKFAGSNPAEAV